MRSLRSLATVAACLGALAACSGDDEAERGLDPIETPAFAPDGSGGTTTTSAGAQDSSSTAGDPAAPAAPDMSVPTTTTDTSGGQPAGAARESATFDDPVGDAVGGVDDDAPPWTDLAGGALERQGNAYRLTVRFGGDAPAQAPADRTMNVATFFDVDGDGTVDHELWVNLGPQGWGPVWYDDDGAHPGEASNVSVTVDRSTLQLLFPDVMLDAPPRLRFSLASEYGELEQIGSSFARRDDAPDGDRSVDFPT